MLASSSIRRSSRTTCGKTAIHSGIRPGRTHSEHVSKILKRLTFIGAVYLAARLPASEWMIAGITSTTRLGNRGRGLTGTSGMVF